MLRGGNLSDPITESVTWDGGKILTTGASQLSLSIKAPNGLLNGNFVHPVTKAKTAIKGVVLQQQGSARGYFPGTDQSGSILLEAN